MAKKIEKKATKKTAGARAPRLKKEKIEALPPEVTITLPRSELDAALTVARDFCEKRNTMPVLSHVLLSTNENECILSVTDLEASWTKVLSFQGSQFHRCIPHNVFHNEVKALHSDITHVVLKITDDNSIEMNGRCRIFTLPAEEFPVITQVEGIETDITGLSDKIAKVIPASGESDTRYTLNGVCLDLKLGNVVATDGHRLHKITCTDVREDGTMSIIPKHASQIIVKHKAKDLITVGKDHIALSLAGGVMTARLIEGTYPNYQQIIPTDNPVKVSCHGADLLKVLEGARLLFGTGSVKMTINGQIEISTKNPNLGEYKWYVPCEAKGKSEDITIGFSAQFLIDAIRSYTTKEDDSVTMEILAPLSPCLINQNAVVMPMRV